MVGRPLVREPAQPGVVVEVWGSHPGLVATSGLEGEWQRASEMAWSPLKGPVVDSHEKPCSRLFPLPLQLHAASLGERSHWRLPRRCSRRGAAPDGRSPHCC